MMTPTTTLTLCKYGPLMVELIAVDAERGRGLVRALSGRPFGCVGAEVTSDVSNVALSYLTGITPVGVAEVAQPIPVELHMVVDAPSVS